ncbi:ferredoxin reductase-like protein [Annulohypoxylon maeteangense]|uniref:ferredoxin reductase-like protein n=1 Tax=Annulohypoxylon maeteangense TaxID=1927788 RepID=UPI00200735DC|nr:ferredoxin reductase-like protein [Annulohypoxylon maeteangense]KAI0879790.1 ferredoxin reductase-like protein [Annulohypoxylon maeteangense]
MNYALRSTRLSRGITCVAIAGTGAGLYYTYMRSVVHADSGAPKHVFGSGPAFLSLKLESTETVNHNTKRLRFKLPEPDSVSGLSLTSALLTFSWPGGSMLPVLRPYTPINALDEPGAIELLVKRYPNGKQSTHIHSLQPGDSLRFVTRLPGYTWQPNKHSDIMLIAGGAGITPAYQLIRGILQNPDDQTKITLVFGVNTDADLLLREEFEDYKARFPGRFKTVYTVSQPVDGSPFRKGYVSKDLLKEVAPHSETCKIFVCGPPPMEESLVGSKRKPGILGELGYRNDQIHKF